MLVQPTETLELGCLATLPHTTSETSDKFQNILCLSLPINKIGRVIATTSEGHCEDLMGYYTQST